MKVGYVRVSDKDQTLNLQMDALTLVGCKVIYADHGISGRKIKRKGLDELLKDLKKDDTLCVWKIDRLGRSTVHLLLLLYDLRKRGVNFISTTEGIDTTTALGRMVYGQLALFAEFEREQISERTKAGMRAARARGVHIGRPRKLTKENISEAKRCIEKHPIETIAAKLDVSVSTLTRALKAEFSFTIDS